MIELFTYTEIQDWTLRIGKEIMEMDDLSNYDPYNNEEQMSAVIRELHTNNPDSTLSILFAVQTERFNDDPEKYGGKNRCLFWCLTLAMQMNDYHKQRTQGQKPVYIPLQRCR